jgi:biotin carboxylase
MSDRPTEYLLILGGSSDQLYIQRVAREMGLGVCCVDGDADAPGLASADHSAPIDFSHAQAVIAWVESLRSSGVSIVGVSSMGSDHPECLRACAEPFGWSSPSLASCILSRDKYEMALAWQAAGVPVPRFEVAHSAADVAVLWRDWGCDGIVVKPTLSCGSRGVSILTGRAQAGIDRAFERAAAEGSHVLVEELVQGLQLSTEAVYHDGKRIVIAVSDRNYDDAESWLPQPMENGGWMPTALHPRQVAEVERVADEAAAALGIVSGPAKGDMVWCPGRGPVMFEMGARLSGGDFASGTVPLSSGIDYVRTVIEIAIGRKPTRPARTRDRVVANRYLFTPAGRLEAARGCDEVAAWPGVVKLELWAKPGDELQPIEHHGRRRGVFIAEGGSRAEVEQVIAAAYDRLEIAVNGRWWKCHPAGRRAWTR